jgi:hypothetical protein
MIYFPRLALNRDPPDLCLLSSWDYRLEPLCPALPDYFSLLSFHCSPVPCKSCDLKGGDKASICRVLLSFPFCF